MSSASSLAQVVAALERRYPPSTAEEWDAVGLVCGDLAAPVRRILWAVDPVEEVVDEAIAAHVDLVITHHPLFLSGVHSVATTTAKGRIVHRLIGSGIALYCAREKNGVRVNSVQPGTILTPNVESVIAGTPDPDATRAAFSIAQPIGRMGEVEDIAHLVVYLASDESKFATGAPFIVDGGLSIA